MRKTILYIILLIFPIILYSQSTYTISGYITDKNTGEVLIGGTIYEESSMQGTITNGYGFFSLSLPKGNYTIVSSYMGYNSATFTIELNDNKTQNIKLEEKSNTIDEITITENQTTNPIQSNEFNFQKISVKNIKQLPSVFGEADLIKAVQLQSGVKTLGDGSSGMFIRGGSSDQNLILIDEAPIYNPSHMFGLISVFNPDALNNVTFYKSNMPAQYGGRVSAVVDCKMKEGNIYDYHYSAGINPFSFSLFANGPLIKEKSAFLVSARKSLVDVLFSPDAQGVFEIVPAYYDINVKLNTKLSKKDRLFLSVYHGNDRLQSADGFYNEWGNLSSTLRWNRNLSAKWFSNVTFIYSDYINDLLFSEDGRDYEWHTGVNDLNFKTEFAGYLSPNNTVKFGFNSIYHKFIPGESADTLESISRIQAFEHAAFILHDIKLFPWLGLNYGLRLSVFQNTGNALWYDYDIDDLPLTEHTNETGVYNTSAYLEPRISVNISTDPRYSFKLAYGRNAQYMQVLQNSSLSYTSLETWFPANPNIDPILVDVFSVGWFRKAGKQFFISAEAYYKQYQNRIDYVDHARLTNNRYIEAETRTGTEEAYGIELELQKQQGKFSGSLSYSYSRSLRQIEGINKGEKYSSPYDIPHDIRINGSYTINENWSISSIWLFTSGRPVSLPIGFYYEGYNAVPIYSDRNSSRFPHYHRLDIAAIYTTEPHNKKMFWDIGFGIYNVYARQNSIGYNFDRFGSNFKVQQYSLFTLMPNFSIKANF
jgi:hypothetical protein